MKKQQQRIAERTRSVMKKNTEIRNLQRSKGSCLLEMVWHPKPNSCCTRRLEKSNGGTKHKSLHLDTGWHQNQHKHGKTVRSEGQISPYPNPRMIQMIQNMEICSHRWLSQHIHHNLNCWIPTLDTMGLIFTLQLCFRKVRAARGMVLQGVDKRVKRASSQLTASAIAIIE